MSQQMENMNRKIQVIKRNEIEILEPKSTITDVLKYIQDLFQSGVVRNTDTARIVKKEVFILTDP